MRSDIKEFYKLQYKWIRLQHPSIQVATDHQHPIHQIELDISHTEHIVHNLIKDVLSEGDVFTNYDIQTLIDTFSNIRSKLMLMDGPQVIDDYQSYIDQTLKLLDKAAAIVS